MASRSTHTAPFRRAARSLWVLVVLAVLASGSLSAAVSGEAGPLMGARVAVSGLVLVVCVVLAARVMTAVERARRRGTTQRRAR